MICLAVNYLVKKKSIHFIFQILVFFFIFIQISSFKGNRYCLKKKKKPQTFSPFNFPFRKKYTII